MRLQLETFERVSLLLASRAVGLEDARILLAGVLKLVTLGRPWILVDLCLASLDESAVNFLSQRSTSLEQEMKGKVQIYWVEGFANFCQFEDLSTALDELKFDEFRELGSKVELAMTKENLEKLIGARDRVKVRLERPGQSIEALEIEYVKLNRGLRAAQTQIINRLLDPVFGDFGSEPLATPEMLTEIGSAIEKISKEKIAKYGSALKDHSGLNKSKALYQAVDMNKAITELSEIVKSLRVTAEKSLLESKADRSVSLILENDTIRERIEEVRETWLQKLLGDSVTNVSDFKNGYKLLIDAIQSKLEADSAQKPNSKTAPLKPEVVHVKTEEDESEW